MKRNINKNTIMIIALILISSCRLTINCNKPPLHKVFKSISQEANIDNINDCSNKAAKYLKALTDEGFNASIVVVKNRAGFHAIIKHNEIYHDPTLGFTSIQKLAFFGNYQYELNYADLEDYAPEFIINEKSKGDIY